MTRKDYRAISDVMSTLRKAAAYGSFNEWTHQDYDAIDKAVDELCDVFAADNPRFDRKRFLKACMSVER
jgi:hypothetical protein